MRKHRVADGENAAFYGVSCTTTHFFPRPLIFETILPKQAVKTLAEKVYFYQREQNPVPVDS